MVTVTVTSSFNCRFPVFDHCTAGWIPVFSSKTLCLFDVSLPTLPLISASLTSSSAKLSTCIFVIKMGNSLTPRAMTSITQSTMTATSMYPSPLLSRSIFLICFMHTSILEQRPHRSDNLVDDDGEVGCQKTHQHGKGIYPDLRRYLCRLCFQSLKLRLLKIMS